MTASLDPLPRVTGAHVLEGVALVVEHCPVRLEERAVSVQHQDMLGKKSMSCRSSRSSCRSLFSARFRSSMSVPVAYQQVTRPLSSSTGLYLNEKPSVLAICSAARCSFSNGTMPESARRLVVAKSRSVFGMEDPFPKVVRLHLVERQSRVLEGERDSRRRPCRRDSARQSIARQRRSCGEAPFRTCARQQARS